MWSFSFGVLLGSFLFSATIAQAETTYFVCDDWQGVDNLSSEQEEVTFEGTLFIGKKTNDNYTIRNKWGNKLEVEYIGDYNSTGVKLYSGTDTEWATPSYKPMSIFAVHKYDFDNYNFQLKQFRFLGGNLTTNCKYE